jgi:hypothetical protein
MLKKCVVIMVMFALVAGAAFAQITFGGQLQEGMTLFSGNNVKYVANEDTKEEVTDVNMGGTYNSNFHEAKFSVFFGDGTAGGRVVYELNNAFLWGWMQWRPSQFFRVKIGSDGDGEGGFPQIIGWGFTGEAKNSVAAVNDYQGGLYMAYRNSGLNYGAYDDKNGFHLQLSVFPTDLIQVNFLFRNFGKEEGEITEKLAKMQIYSSIKLEEIGTIRVAAVGKGGFARHVDSAGSSKDGDGRATFHLAFYSNEIVQGLAFELGGQYDMVHRNRESYDPIKVGGGINLTATDPFNLKIRFGTEFGGKSDDGKGKVEDIEKTGFSVGLLPSFKLPKMTIFFHAGFGMEQANKDADSVYEWFINPYVWVPMGGMRMWIGVQIIDQHSIQDGQFKWNVPFGFNFYF